MKNVLNISLALGAVAAAGLVFVGCQTAATPKTYKPKALVIMLDGTRADGLVNAPTPNIDKLRNGTWQPGYHGAWSDFAQTVPDARPSSAANHTAIATGAAAAKTGMYDNGALSRNAGQHWKEWPTWMTRVTAEKNVRALFTFSWGPDKNIAPDPLVTYLQGSDADNVVRLAKILAGTNAPDAVQYYIDIPDHAGHSKGFYPYSAGYLPALTQCDGYIGACMNAIASRPTFQDEDWLIVITADHGGQSTTHGLWGGQCTTIPFVVSSRSTPSGYLAGGPRNRDAAAVALKHFGLDAAKYKLDAQVPQVAEPAAKRALKDGLAAYLPCDEKTFANSIAGEVKVQSLGPRTAFQPKDGKFGGCASFTGAKGVLGGLRLAGSEKLAFENKVNFAVTLWTRLPKDQEGDALVFGNKDWNKGINPGVGLISAKCTDGVKVPGVAFNAIPGDGRPRVDLGAFVTTYDQWTFYGITCTKDGLLVMCQGTPDGRFYWVADRAPALKLETGLPWAIGQDGTGKYPDTLRGDVDDFALWTRSLSLDEMRYIFEKGRLGQDLGGLIR